MAEKQLAYRASRNDELFADDDPLAELARIVGFDQRPSAPVAPVVQQRQEPAFNLEDELLREFERYDAPRLSPVDDIAVPPEEEPVREQADPAPAIGNDGSGHHDDAEPEFSDLRADVALILQAASRAGSEARISGEEPDAHDRQVSPPAHERWQQPAAEPEQHIAEAPVTPDAAGHQDLADELELSIGDAPVVPPISAVRVPQWAAASIRLPLANFNAPRRDQPVREDDAPAAVTMPAERPSPVVEARAPETGDDFGHLPSLGFPAEQDRHEDHAADLHVAAQPVAAAAPEISAGFDLAAAAGDGFVQADAALTEPAYADPSRVPSIDVDELLADVSRYPVPRRAEPAATRVEPDFDQAATGREAPISAPVVIAPAPVDASPQTARQEPDLSLADAADPFADQDFDFDLEGIELELADFDFTDARDEAPAAVQPAPGHAERPSAAAQSGPVAVEPRPTPVAPAVRVPPAVRPELAARPVTAPIIVSPVSAPAASHKAQPVIDADQALPFDPSEITDTEDRVETFEGMHVPTLPPIEREEPITVPPEYDFDIDAEMASLFNTAVKETAPEPVRQAAGGAAAASWTNPAPAREMAAKKPGDDLDEFERALEEDFRRSFSEAAHPAENIARMTLETASVTADRRRARSMRGLAAAAAMVVVVGAGAYAGYGWLSRGPSLGLSSGEPRVIAADKDPVKVVPENPGGKIVPNQDKAVYDRVAGDAAPAPKQKELVSSDEQPVDVVQKTLIPEAVSPDDNDGGDGPVTSTPVGETEDPRLLPNQGNNADTAANDQSQDGVPSVSPRKVRTMIVKPDGTLVARDESAPAIDDTVKTAAAVPPLAKASSDSAGAAPANGLASADLRPAASDAESASSSALADAADSDAASAESTPIRVVKTTKVADAKVSDVKPADTAPLPASRPAQQPVNIVGTVTDHGNVRPAQTQVASATPATQPVRAAPAASAGAGGYVVQIASLPSEDDAKRSQANLSAKFASVIGGHPMEIRKFDIAGKGTYYRVRVVAGSKDDAAALCVRYRQAGGTCLISK